MIASHFLRHQNWAIFSLILLFGIPPVLLSAEIPQRAVDWQKTAEQCLRQTNYTCARDFHQKVVDSFPQTEYAFRSMYHLVLIDIKCGNYTSADEAIQGLLSDYADHKEIDLHIRRIAASYLDVNQPSRSKQLCQTQLSVCQNRAEIVILLQVLAIAQIQLGEYSETEPIIHLMINDYNTEKETCKNIRKIVTAYCDANQFSEAKKLCQLALSVWPNSSDEPYLLRDLVTSCIRLGDSAGAEEAMAVFVSRYQGHQVFNDSIEAIISSCLELKKSAITEKPSFRVLSNWSAQKDDIVLKSNTAITHIQSKEYVNAGSVTKQLLNDSSAYPGAMNSIRDIIGAYSTAGKYNEAVELCRSVLAKWPDHYESIFALRDLAVNLIRLGEYAEAEAMTAKLLNDYSKDKAGLSKAVYEIGEGYYIRGDEAFQEGNKEQADADFRKAIAFWEKNRRVITNSRHQAHAAYCTAMAYKYLQDYETAIQLYQDLLSRYSDHEYAWNAQLSIGICYELAGEKGIIPAEESLLLARESYALVLENYPNCPEANYAAQWVIRYDSENKRYGAKP